jgi:hypothetical protein
VENLANDFAVIKTLIDNDNLVNAFDLRVSNQQLQHFIHWREYDVNEHIWEAIKRLSNAMEKMNNLSTISKRVKGHRFS